MAESPDVLWLRVLLCFLQDSQNATVMAISKMLGEKPYKITRILNEFEKRGWLYRDEMRKSHLTDAGRAAAERYANRLETAQNHLLYEGVNSADARRDALHWALYNSAPTMRVIQNTNDIYRIKYELRGREEISGGNLFKMFHDGEYFFPFTFYREHAKDGEIISMADRAFEHPCQLTVRDGVGTIHLQAVSITGNSALNGKIMAGKIQTMKYAENGDYTLAECNGSVLSFPAAPLKFRVRGFGVRQDLVGRIFVKMKCSVGVAHMPESLAVFTISIL